MNPAMAYTRNFSDMLELLGLGYFLFLMLAAITVGLILSGIVIAVRRWWHWTYRDLLDPATWLHGGTPPRSASLRRDRSSPPMGATRSPLYVTAGNGDAPRFASASTGDLAAPPLLRTSPDRPRPPGDRFAVTSLAAGQDGAK